MSKHSYIRTKPLAPTCARTQATALGAHCYGQLPALARQNSTSPRYIDANLASAFEAMRKTEAGREVYQWFLDSDANADSLNWMIRRYLRWRY